MTPFCATALPPSPSLVSIHCKETQTHKDARRKPQYTPVVLSDPNTRKLIISGYIV